MKSTLKRFLSLVLCMCMVMALLPNVTMTAFAATSGTVTGLADENIGLSFTGDADDAWSANGTSIIGAATSTGGTCGNTSYKSTLTITNKKSTTATLSFDYSIEQNSGKIQVDGTEVSSGASFTKELATNESVKVYIQSGSTSAATKITLTNVVLVSDVNATATFVPAENGTYTVDGKLITEEYSNTQSSMTAYQVVATPADGYQFMGWYDVSNEKYISTSAKAALNIENDCTITARFASKTAALFETGGQRFDDLGDAVSYAQANSQSKITLAADGSISEIPRESYLPAEQRVVQELEALGKPFVILLNSTHPDAPETRALAAELEQSYGRSVLAVSCLDLDAAALNTILQKVLYEFPVRELDFALPRWVTMLDKGHWLQTEVYSAAMAFSEQVTRMKDLSASGGAALACDAVQQTALSGMNLSDGIVRVTVILKPEVFYQVLSEQTGLEIGDEAGLMPCILSLAKASREYEKIRSALEQVEATGYGIVMPTIDELSLEQPEIVQQGGRYGVRLEASAPSIQMMKATIHTEISPIVGTEKQSEDLVQSLLQDFESDPVKLWESNIFGKSLHELVNDGLQNKLLHMPQEARTKMQETLEQVINEGCTGLICILL